MIYIYILCIAQQKTRYHIYTLLSLKNILSKYYPLTPDSQHIYVTIHYYSSN